MTHSRVTKPRPRTARSVATSRILLLAATEAELAPLLRRVTVTRRLDPELRAVEATLAQRALTLAETGVGKCNAAMTTFALLREHPAAITIMTGCAGAFPGSGLRPGDVVVGDREILADDGVAAPQGFLDLHEVDLPVARNDKGEPVFNRIPLLHPPDSSLYSELDCTVKIDRLATVSTCSGTDERAAAVERLWGPAAESMEGAAAALAALRAGCPFMEIRGISNVVGNRDRAAWQVARACENAALAVLATLPWLDGVLGAGG